MRLRKSVLSDDDGGNSSHCFNFLFSIFYFLFCFFTFLINLPNFLSLNFRWARKFEFTCSSVASFFQRAKRSVSILSSATAAKMAQPGSI